MANHVLPSPPRSVLADFLSAEKAKYLEDVQNKTEDWTVVMGNESGDLDSIASSIAFAYYQSVIQHKPTIPFIQIARDDLSLRGENIYALELAGITETVAKEKLFLLSDISSTKSFSSHKFALVDHNRLGLAYASGDAQVVAIVDHHADEGLYTDPATTNPRIITPTGSCSSLITISLFVPSLTRSGTSNTTSESEPLPIELSTLLLSAILIDTDGLKPGGKAVDADREAAAFLASSANLWGNSPSSSLSPSSLHDAEPIQTLTRILTERKLDLSHLSAYDLLRRDYKEYIYDVPWASSSSNNSAQLQLKAGLSTVPLALSSWATGAETGRLSELERQGGAADRWMRERGLNILGVLTSYRRVAKKQKEIEKGKGKHEREMAWIIRTESPEINWNLVEEKLWAGLRASEELEVKEHKEFPDTASERGANLRFKVFMQNPQATRKVTAPVLKGIMEGKT
ncbi:Exopolyphosphatase [Stygiomarasmius scandens]|uniref:Exopolyphosphatase n=1 Tax=Marasmiellus scandens TaxID=2682957 RepID=A0ABR1JFL4_9AGAR